MPALQRGERKVRTALLWMKGLKTILDTSIQQGRLKGQDLAMLRQHVHAAEAAAQEALKEL